MVSLDQEGAGNMDVESTSRRLVTRPYEKIDPWSGTEEGMAAMSWCQVGGMIVASDGLPAGHIHL